MSKITKITIENFRAFYGKYEFEVGGKNVLIYGENGSGKSSLFAAVRDFIKSSEPSNNITFDRNIYAAAQDAAHITFELESDSALYQFKKIASSNQKAVFQEPAKLEGWLTYRELLQTYLDTNSNNLFNILWEFWIKHLPSQLTPTTQETIGEYWLNTIIPSLHKLEEERANANTTEIDNLLKKQREYLANIKSVFESFFITSNENGEVVLNRVNDWLSKAFKANIKLSFKVNVKTLEEIEITPKIEYNGRPLLKNYRSFLNEARLSALATCLYLSMLLDKPQRDEQLKVLFLDDIFIGLDMSNRLPLLEILKDKFSGWQIFMTTYDRHWFEVAKSEFGTTNWLPIEMYVGEEEIKLKNKYQRQTSKQPPVRNYVGKEKLPKSLIQKPVIISPSLNHFEKAEKYFEAKDYPAAANYLRKSLEEALSSLLPNTHTRDEKSLERLIDMLFTYYENNNFSELLQADITTKLKNFKDSFLNPASHHNIKSPYYKAEIEKVIILITELRKIPKLERKVIIPIGKRLIYKNSAKNYKATYILLENMYKVTAFTNGNPTVKISFPKHILFTYVQNGITFFNLKNGVHEPLSKEEILKRQEEEITMNKRLEKLKHFLGLENLSLIEESFFYNNKELKDL